MRSLLLPPFLLLLLAGLLPAASFEEARASGESSLEEALARLSTLREEIAEEKIPLAKRLNALEADVIDLRRKAERSARQRDARELDLGTLEADVKARQEEIDYVESLLTEYLTSLESFAHPAEWPAYEDTIGGTLLALDDPEKTQEAKFIAQLEGVVLGMDRLETILGGTTFEGQAVTEGGDFTAGQFVLFGPAAYFAANGLGGLALEGEAGAPLLVPVEGTAAGVQALASGDSGELPLDPTLGKAIALASTRESLVEHIAKGGVWIYPILFAAALSLVIAAIKFMEIYTVKEPRPGAVHELIRLVRSGKKQEALHKAKELPGPSGEMLHAGVEHSDEPKELLEEILLEKMVETQPKIERLLPIIAVTAATAPLLGLLGTVTGMINTFKLITIFGTGDAKSLSGGISEALITTEFGLIVAIPSLILHALLSRRAKGILARMENTAMTFVNGIQTSKGKTDAA